MFALRVCRLKVVAYAMSYESYGESILNNSPDLISLVIKVHARFAGRISADGNGTVKKRKENNSEISFRVFFATAVFTRINVEMYLR